MSHSFGIKAISKIKTFAILSLLLVLMTIGGIIFTVFKQNQQVDAAPADAFITTWRVSGDETGRTIRLPIYKAESLAQYAHLAPININFTIDWGDGSPLETITAATITNGSDNIRRHTYASPGDYQVKIEGDFPGWDLGSLSGDNAPNSAKLIKLNQWGTTKWRHMKHLFYYAVNMEAAYVDRPDTSLVADMSKMFYENRKFNGAIDFDTRNVTNMSAMFFGASVFNQPVNFSDTSMVTDMSSMFWLASSFNQPINFNTRNVTNMNGMFGRAIRFNKPLNLNTSKVENMGNMFQQSAFNQPLNFDTSNVKQMNGMFRGNTAFNQPLNFDTRNVTDMGFMFYATNITQPITFSDTSKVTDMKGMFQISRYNHPINFNTSSVKDMSLMFAQSNFNQPLNFDTRNVTTMESMFRGGRFNSSLTFSDTSNLKNTTQMFTGATAFNRPITFNTGAVTNMTEMFSGATAFNQDLSGLDYSGVTPGNLSNFVSNSGLSAINNDKLISRWYAQLGGGYTPHSTGLTYCKAAADRTALIANGWVFADTRDCSAYQQPPQDISLSATEIAENSTANAQVATITVAKHADDNPDDVDTVSLTCAASGADDAAFTVTNNRLYINNPANYEVKNSYNICLRATDSTNFTLDKNFTITVRDVNEAPVFTSVASVTLDHNETRTHNLTATDPDTNSAFNNLNFSATGLPSWISLNGSTLNITPTIASVGTHNITVRVSDGTNTTAQNLQVVINEANLTPIINAQNFSIAENSANGTMIGQVVATDPNTNTTLSYSIVNGNDLGIFSITGTGQIRVANHAQLNYEQTDRVVLRVRVADSWTPSLTAEADITINITDVNEAPVISGAPATAVNQDANYSFAPAATDPDTTAPNNTITFSIANKPNWVNFDTATGVLTGTPGNSHVGVYNNITITVTDGRGLMANLPAFTITVNNVNDAPTISSQSFSIVENSVDGSVLGQVVAGDIDTGDTLSYAITAGNDLNIFEITNTGSLRVRNNANLNFEQTNQIVLTIRVTDNGVPALSSESEVIVSVTDVDEAPVFTSIDKFSIGHNETRTYTLIATDPENQILRFSANNLPMWTQLADDTLTIAPNSPDLIGEHDITLTVSDGINTTDQVFTITVVYVDDQAPTINLSVIDPITVTTGNNFATPAATCSDNYSNCTLTITNPVDINTPGVYYIVYKAIDESGNQTIAQVQVTVVAKPKSSAPQPQEPQAQTPAAPKPTTPHKPSTTTKPAEVSVVEEEKGEVPPFTLKGDKEITLNLNDFYNELGITCAINTNCIVEITGKVDTSKPGVYTITYKLAGGDYKLTRTIVVREPVVEKSGEKPKNWWQDAIDFVIKLWWIWLILLFVWWFIIFWKRHKEEKEEDEVSPRRRRKM